MSTQLIRRYTFSAAHKLSGAEARHECSQLHGHTYKVELVVSRIDYTVDKSVGWVIDAADLDRMWERVSRVYDHCFLNESLGEDSPTVENLARRIFEHMGRALMDSKVMLRKVSVSEGDRTTAVYDG